MVNPKCYRAIKGCDDVIAEDPRFHTKKADGTIKKLSPEAIANLRSLYDEYLEQDGKPNFLSEYEDKDIPEEVISKLADTLYAFRTKLQQTRGSRLYNKLSSSTNFSLSFINIARSLSPAVVQESSEFIAQLFRKKANTIAQAHNQRFGTSITYLDVIKGVKSKKGKMLYGKNYLLDTIYYDVAEAYINNGDKARSKIDSQDLWNVLLAWGPLVTRALTIIGNQERLNIGLFKDFAYDKSNGILSAEVEDSFQDMEEDVHDVEESTKESWQEDKNKKPLLSRVLDVVKRELAAIVDERAQSRVTTLPVYKRIALDEVHTFLAQQLCEVPNETEMIKQLQRLDKQYQEEKQAEETARNRAKENGEEYIPYGISMPSTVGHHLMETFSRDASFKTAMFVSYSTAFTAFSKFRQYADKKTKGIYAFFRNIINREAYKPKNDIRAFLRSRDFPQEIFRRDEDGDLVFSDNARTLIETVITDFSAPVIEASSNNEGNVFTKMKGYSYSEIMKKLRSADPMMRQNAIAYLAQSIRNLGINITTNDLVKANAASMINGNFLDALVELYAQLKDIEKAGVIGDNYFKIATEDSGYGKDLETFAKLVYEIIGKTKYESRALVLDKNGNKSSVSSMQAPCYFTDFFGTLKYYYNQMKQAIDPQTAEEYKQLGLDFIKSRYEGTFILKPDGTTNNPILSALLESFHGNSTFLENFSHDRYAEMDINSKEARAEKLSDIDVALTMFHSFYGPHLQNRMEGMFPLFILGDSNVHRYMSAPLYTKEEAIKTMVKLVKAELDFEKDLAAVNKDLKSKNFEEIKGTSNGIANSWISDIKKLRDKYLEEKQEEEALKQAIIDVIGKNYLDFLQKWEEKELNKSSKFGYRFFGINSQKEANVKTREEMTQALELFVYNYAVNTVSQLQLMTVSTMYYPTLEELQKRYKEIHASGSKLNVEASNPYAQPDKDGKHPPIFIDKDGHFYPYERVIYFDDILINVEKTDPDFAKVVEKVVGRDSQNYANYLKSTLTDGQSYRSIDSYRKIAIAQGQWNKNLEEWYQKLQEFKRSMKGQEFTVEQLKELDSYNVILQPQKPYLFTHERYSFEDIAGNSKVLSIPVQHKCAEVILIPELLPAGSNLRHLAEAMSENNIDVACSTEVVKVGMFGSTSIAYRTNDKNLFIDKDGNIIPAKDGKTENITRKDQMKNPDFPTLAISLHGKNGTEIKKALMKGYVHELDLSTYYRQQNLPAHVNDPRALGTQMRKIIFTAIKNDGDYSSYFPGLTNPKTKRTNLKLFSGMQSIDVGATSGRGGANLCKFYNGLIVQNIIESFENLVKKLADNVELAPILQQMSLNNSRNTVYDLLNYALAIEKGENEDERLRDFLVPLCDPTTSKDTISTLISLFRNEVNKQIMCGGSAVQASAFGIEEVVHDDAAKSNHKDIHTPDDGNLRYVCEYETDEKGNYALDENGERIPINILYAECEMPFDLYYTDESGKKVNLEYDDYVNADGTLKMTTDKNGKEIPLLEKEFPGILDVIAYRIPTERAYSAINLRIKRFSRKVNGGTIKVPSASSTIAGFDFDADKLFFVRKEFVYKSREMSETENLDTWEAVWNKHDIIKQALLNKRTELFGENDKTPLNQLREHIDLAELGYEKDVTLQDLYNEEARRLGFTRGFIEYQYDKTIDENSKVARNNEILRLIQQRLMDKETLPARYTPGGFADHKLTAKKMRIAFQSRERMTMEELNNLSLDEDNEYRLKHNILNPWTFVEYNKQNQAAGELIGIFANQNINHIFTSIAHTIRITNGIRFADREPLFDLIHPPQGIDTEATTAGFLAASVDAVKDPVLNFMNLNSITADTGALLARIGFNTDEIALLFNQPIIREVCEYYFNNHMTDMSKAINKIREDYTKHYDATDIPSGEQLGMSLSKQGLLNAIIDNNNAISKKSWKENPSVAKFQLEVLDTFIRAHRAAEDLVAFVRATKFTAAKSIESTIGGLYYQMGIVENYINSPGAELIVVPSENAPKTLVDFTNQDILGKERQNYLMQVMENPFAFEQVMYDMTRLYTTETLARLSPHETPTFKGIRGAMNNMTRHGILNKASINEIHNDLFLYILTKLDGTIMNANAPFTTKDGKEVSYAEYYREVFPSQFEELMAERRKQGKPENAFLNSIKVGTDKNEKVYLAMNNVFDQNNTIKEERMQGWSELALSKDGDDIELAFDLFVYLLYNTGFSLSGKSFIHYATPFIKTELPIFKGGSYADFLRGLNNKDESKNLGRNINGEDFILRYIQNHTDDYQFVYSPYDSDEQKALSAAAKDENTGELKESFEVTRYIPNSNQHSTYYNKVFLREAVDQNNPNISTATVIPAIMIDDSLYVLEQLVESSGEYNHVTTFSRNEGIRYVRMPILGKFGIKNYNPGAPKQTQEPQPQSKKAIKHGFSMEEEKQVLSQILDKYPAYKSTISKMRDLGLSLEDAILNTRYLKDFSERYKKGSFVIFDTETTGLNVFEDDIIQIAATKIEEGVVTETFEVVIHTDRTIPTKLGNSINPMVEVYEKSDKVSQQEGLQKFIQFVGDSAIVAHNLDYDYNILNQNFSRNNISGVENFLSLKAFDSLKLIRLVNPNLKSYKLNNIVKQLELQGEGTHNAKDDIIATKSVVDYCYDECQALIPQQDEFLKEPDVKEALEVLRQQYEKLFTTLLPDLASSRNDSSVPDVDNTEGSQQQGVDDGTTIVQQKSAEVGATSNEKDQNSVAEIEDALQGLQKFERQNMQTTNEVGEQTEACH